MTRNKTVLQEKIKSKKQAKLKIEKKLNLLKFNIKRYSKRNQLAKTIINLLNDKFYLNDLAVLTLQKVEDEKSIMNLV